MSKGRVWLSGFFLLGLLLGLLGPLLVLWRYQIDVEPHLIGMHFLAVNAGYVIAAAVCGRLLRKRPPAKLARAGCSMAALSFVALTFAGPPTEVQWRLAVLAMMGLAAGTLGSALLYGCEGLFRMAPLGAVFKGAFLFGAGCLTATAICGATYFLGSTTIGMLMMAAIACVYVVFFWRAEPIAVSARPDRERELLHETLRDLRSVATVLFGVLVFFQFGNEWAIAGWLPLFLIHRLGSNPALAVGVLAVYFVALTTGRLTAGKLLGFVSQRRLLVASIVVAVCGFVLLEMTDSLAGATAAVVVIGAGFAAIYPLISEQLDERFSYHPGFYNGIISIAVTGAMSVPWLLGFIAASFGMGYVMLLPAIGSIVVLIATLLLMFEAHLMQEKKPGRAA